MSRVYPFIRCNEGDSASGGIVRADLVTGVQIASAPDGPGFVAILEPVAVALPDVYSTKSDALDAAASLLQSALEYVVVTPANPTA